jgi:hypothetical protein
VTTKWIHRATWSDGEVFDTPVREYALPDGPHLCLAEFGQVMLRTIDPGATVEHLIKSDDDEEWHTP